MKLPQNWNKEIKTLEAKINEIESNRDRLTNRMTKEIDRETARIQDKYFRKMGLEELDKLKEVLEQRKEEVWENIRRKYNITHPPIKKRFMYNEDAAKVLAHYWIGESIEEKRLLREISFPGNNKICQRAYHYAINLTEPNTPEREYVKRAYGYIWRGYPEK